MNRPGQTHFIINCGMSSVKPIIRDAPSQNELGKRYRILAARLVLMLVHVSPKV